jgi:hypothetical protein
MIYLVVSGKRSIRRAIKYIRVFHIYGLYGSLFRKHTTWTLYQRLSYITLTRHVVSNFAAAEQLYADSTTVSCGLLQDLERSAPEVHNTLKYHCQQM